MNNFLKNLGILLIVLGTAVLVLSYVCNWLDYNWPNGIALLAIVVGIIVHIVMKSSRKSGASYFYAICSYSSSVVGIIRR